MKSGAMTRERKVLQVVNINFVLYRARGAFDLLIKFIWFAEGETKFRCYFEDNVVVRRRFDWRLVDFNQTPDEKLDGH